MSQERPVLITTEEKQNLPILIVDKAGRIGGLLAEKLQEQFLVVVVTGKETVNGKNIIHIPYRRRIPLIPDNTYSHMFLVYNGDQTLLEMLPSFVKKANQTNSRVLFITSIFETNEKLFRYLANHTYYHVTKIVYGELFDNSTIDRSTVNVFIQQARAFGKIELPNEGLGKTYPVLVEDVLTAIIGIAFASEQKQRVSLAFPNSGYTALSIARIMQKLHPLLRLDFGSYKARRVPFYWPQDSQTVFPTYDLEAKLRQITLSPGEYPLQSIKRVSHPARTRIKKDVLLPIFVFLFSFFVLPIIALVLSLGLGGAFLAWSLQSLTSGKLDEAKQQVGIAQTALGAAYTLNGATSLLSALAPSQQANLQQQIENLQEAAGTETDVLQAIQVTQGILSQKSTDPSDDFLEVVALLKKSFIALQKMKAEQTLPAAVLAKLDSMNSVLPLLENTIDTFPDLLGFNGTRTYLVLFQNNMELRPGGGFIGSYAVVKVQNGNMENFKTFDVYDADGKLTQSVTPPFALQRYLGATHWFLRDSNFDPDFVRDAASAMQFYHMETGGSVDGVIAIDTDFLKTMLTVFGPIYLPDYRVQVTADNFYILTEEHAENNFFPGSTQKKDFLSSLFTAMEIKVFNEKSLPVRQLLTAVGTAIKQKHVLFAFPQQASQTVFTVNDLSGSLWDGRQLQQNTFLDYLGVIDANLGANKANYYLKRAIEQDVNIASSGSAAIATTVTYTNTSTATSQFGGDYKNYVRFILPAGAQLQSVNINNQQMQTTPAITDPLLFTSPAFVPPKGLEVEKADEEGKTVYGFLVIVPAGKTIPVSITYTVGTVLNLQVPAFTYDLQLFKQPGTENDPYTLLLSYPGAFAPLNPEKGFTNVGGKLLYNGQVDHDQDFKIEFSKK